MAVVPGSWLHQIRMDIWVEAAPLSTASLKVLWTEALHVFVGSVKPSDISTKAGLLVGMNDLHYAHSPSCCSL